MIANPPSSADSQELALGQLLATLDARVPGAELQPEVEQDLLQQADQLKLPASIANALIDAHLWAKGHPGVFGGEALEPLVKELARHGQYSDAVGQFVDQMATRLNLPAQTGSHLLKAEAALRQQAYADARASVETISSVLGTTTDGTAFLTRKRNEVETAEKAGKALAYMASASSTPAPTTQAPASSGAGYSEAILTGLPSGSFSFKEAGLFSHAGGYHWYTQAASGDKKLLLIDGVTYDPEKVQSLYFSPNGSRYAFVKLLPDGRAQLMVDGKESEIFDSVSQLAFSKDGKGFAALGVNNRQMFLLEQAPGAKAVVTGPKSATRELVFNPANNQLAYFAYSNRVWELQHPGQRHEGYAASGELQYSPDGQTVVYWARKGTKVFAVVNGVEQEEFDGVGEFTFGVNGSQLAYLANQRGQLCVVHNDKQGPVYDRVRRISFSRDGKNVAYMAGDATSEAVVLGMSPQKAYDRIHTFAWGPAKNMAHAYIAGQGGKKVLVHNGHTGSEFDEMVQLCYHPERDSVAFVGYRDREWQVYHDGQGSDTYAGVDDLQFTPDGSKLICLARIKGQGTALVVNGKADKPYVQAKNLVASKDGSRLVFLMKQPEGWYLQHGSFTVNTKPFHELLSPLRYDDQKNEFYLLVRRDQDILRITY